MRFSIHTVFLVSLFLCASIAGYAQLDLDFTHTRGYYNASFQLGITCEDPNAIIRYTTNSSAPSPVNGITYSGPISINSNTTLRVYVYNALGDNKTKTHTYLFPNEVKTESYMGTFITNDPTLGPQFEAGLLDIPTVSLVTPNTIDDLNPLAGSFEFFYAKKDLSTQVRSWSDRRPQPYVKHARVRLRTAV